MTTETRTKFPLEELVALPTFMSPFVSWDGRKVAYYSDTTGRMEIWVQNLDSGEAKQVTQGQLPRSLHAGFIWDRGGRTIVFPKDTDGDEQHNLWTVDVESGQATQITDAPGQEIPAQFSPDDASIAFLSTRNGQLNLFVTHRDGSGVRQLTHFPLPVQNAHWSPDGMRLAVTSNESADPHNTDIYLVPAVGGDVSLAFSSGPGTQDSVADWSPDGKSLLITSDVAGVDRPGILDLQSGEVRWFGLPDVEETAYGFSSDGTHLLTVRNKDAVMRPVVYDLRSGQELPLRLPPGSVATPRDVSFALGGRAIIVRSSTTSTRAGLVLYDLTSGEIRTLVEPEYGSIAPSLFVGAEDVHYTSFDGLSIHALLFKPRGVTDADSCPAIVIPHGGPTWQYSHVFDVFPQFLVNEGYVVLEPNIRGSTGYGVGFRDMARFDWGGADLKDIVAGREFLAQLPYVDPNRIGVFGGSYGGFMTFIAMTKAPDRWKAGAALVGVSDLPTMYEESMPHFKTFLEEQMGKPEENKDLWADRSAVNFVADMQAKLLIAHGVNDPRCPIGQARVVRDRLVELGRKEGEDYEYVELEAEGHGSTDRGQRLRMLQLVGDFFARSL